MAREYYWQDLPEEIQDELWRIGLKRVRRENGNEETLDDEINRNNSPKTITEWEDFIEEGEEEIQSNPRKQSSDFPVKFTETLEGFEVSQKFNIPDVFDYHLVLVITDMEEASEDPELLAEGKWLVSLDLVPDFKDFDKEHQKSILQSSGVTRREVSPEDIQMYGCSITCYWEQDDELELIVRDLKEKAQIAPAMVGSFLDKAVNRIGETGWDKLEEWGVI